MNTIKAVCKCKEFSENDLVMGIRKNPFEDWGCGTWIFNITLLVVTSGGWLPFIGGWVLGSYFFFPQYKCQLCGETIEQKNYRM